MKTKLLLLFTLLAIPLSGIAIENVPQDAATLTITTGGTSQALFSANPNRRYLLVQNQSDTDMYINFGAAATTGPPSVKIIPGSAYQDTSNPPTTTITIMCATTGKAFSAKQGGS